jgi:hypothetical protein
LRPLDSLELGAEAQSGPSRSPLVYKADTRRVDDFGFGVKNGLRENVRSWRKADIRRSPDVCGLPEPVFGRVVRAVGPRCDTRRVSARFQGKDKDLAGIYAIWISDLVSVRFVNDRVSRAHAVGDTADAPQAVATRYDRGRNLGLDHGGR